MKIAMADEATTESTLVHRARRMIVAEIARDDAYLMHLLNRPFARALHTDALSCLTACAGGRARLTDLAADARAATTLAELQQTVSLVRQLRREIDTVAVVQAQDLAALSATAEANVLTLADLDAIVTERGAAGKDRTSIRIEVVAARLLNSEAKRAIAAVRDAALRLTAMSGSTKLRAVAGEVLRIWGLLDRVDQRIMLIELSMNATVQEPAQAG